MFVQCVLSCFFFFVCFLFFWLCYLDAKTVSKSLLHNDILYLGEIVIHVVSK